MRSDGPWRVFISHTSELREFPRGRSYVSEVERAIIAAGHVPVDMLDFPAADRRPAHLCEGQVRGSDVYVGLLGTRYGSPVRDKPVVSYTELEFDTATEAGLNRLVFVLDPDAENVRIPPAHLMDRDFGERQDAFRRRVRDSGLTTQSFAEPAKLGQLVERSLRDLADTRRRIESGMQREQVPAEPQPVRASKFINPPPATAPTWFQGRQVETGLLAKYVSDPGIRAVTVVGRGGIGKTAMVCRLLRALESTRIPDRDGELGQISVGGIVYLSHNGVHPIEYPSLIEDLLQLLPAEAAQPVRRQYQDPHHSPRNVMLALLEAFPSGKPVVVLLDNLESVMDGEKETFKEPALRETLTAVLTAPEHAVTVIATTRVTPGELLKLEPARQRQLRLDAGLGVRDAQIVLKALDDDGRLGLRDAPDEVLDGLHGLTRGFPRALEAVKAILDGDDTVTAQDLLDRTRQLPEDRVMQVLVGEAYERLDLSAQQVMQALAVYPGPVSAVAIDFLLSPVNPIIDAAPILKRLVRRRLVGFQNGQYYLHPLDRDYARSQLPAGGPGDSAAEFTLAGLQARAADYYAQVRSPRASWRGLDDVRPQLAEFELRCDTGDYDTAANVLADLDFDYLQVWGHYRLLVALHARIHGRISNPVDDEIHLGNLGLSHGALGDLRRAIDLHNQALAIARQIGDRHGEGANLGNLGLCHNDLGDYQRAIDLHTQALALDREIGFRQAEGNDLGNLGLSHRHLGDYQRAIDLHTQALAVDHDISDRRGEGADLSSLGLCYHDLGDYQQALGLHAQALAINRDLGRREGQSISLTNLASCHVALGSYRVAIDLDTEALAIARDIGDRYIEACSLNCLGRVRLASGDLQGTATLLKQAITIAEETGHVEPSAEGRSWLAQARLLLGEAAEALAVTVSARDLPYPAVKPTLRLLEGMALFELDRGDEALAAFTGAVAAADGLLALADRNVSALQARALALSGLAAATSDAARAGEAADAFARADAVTTAAGVVAETNQLLVRIVALDRAGILAGVRTARGL